MCSSNLVRLKFPEAGLHQTAASHRQLTRCSQALVQQCNPAAVQQVAAAELLTLSATVSRGRGVCCSDGPAFVSDLWLALFSDRLSAAGAAGCQQDGGCRWCGVRLQESAAIAAAECRDTSRALRYHQLEQCFLPLSASELTEPGAIRRCRAQLDPVSIALESAESTAAAASSDAVLPVQGRRPCRQDPSVDGLLEESWPRGLTELGMLVLWSWTARKPRGEASRN